MKTILLTGNSETFKEETIRFSFGLARRIKARLSVLRVINPWAQKSWEKMKGGLEYGRCVFEEGMVTAALAEGGDFETARRLSQKPLHAEAPEPDSPGLNDRVECRIEVVEGQTEKAIARFLDAHREVVLTIYDQAEMDDTENHLKKLKNIVDIPVVTVHKRSRPAET